MISEEENFHLENQKSNFLRTIWSFFRSYFHCRVGDLTQLASATLAAEHKNPVTIFLAAILALWTVTVIAILVGNRAKRVINAGNNVPVFRERTIFLNLILHLYSQTTFDF